MVWGKVGCFLIVEIAKMNLGCFHKSNFKKDFCVMNSGMFLLGEIQNGFFEIQILHFKNWILEENKWNVPNNEIQNEKFTFYSINMLQNLKSGI